MPQAGQVIRAIDFAPLSQASVAAESGDFVTVGFQPTVPACEVTFIAPTSGNVYFDMQPNFDSDAVNEFVQADVEIRESDSSGALIRAADTTDGLGIRWLRDAGNQFESKYGHRIQTGLVPGRTYWAQLQFNSTTGVDLRSQNLAVYGIA